MRASPTTSSQIIRIFFLARAILPIKILDAVTFGLGLQYAFDSYKGRVMTGGCTVLMLDGVGAASRSC